MKAQLSEHKRKLSCMPELTPYLLFIHVFKNKYLNTKKVRGLIRTVTYVHYRSVSYVLIKKTLLFIYPNYIILIYEPRPS